MRAKRLFPWTLVALLVLGAPGCSVLDSDGGDDDRAANNAFDGDAFAMVDVEDAFENIDDATETQRMRMHPVLDGSGRFHRPPRHGHPGGHLGHTLNDMDLTNEQVQQIRDAMEHYRGVVHEQLEGIRAVNQPIIDAANAEREAILQQLEAGEITREEARALLHDLSMRTRQAIRDNPANEPYVQAICEAKRQLFEEIRDILDMTEQMQWDGGAGMHQSCD